MARGQLTLNPGSAKMGRPDGQVAADLEARLESFRSRTMVMAGDGNCQFRAFAFNLFGCQLSRGASEPRSDTGHVNS